MKQRLGILGFGKTSFGFGLFFITIKIAILVSQRAKVAIFHEISALFWIYFAAIQQPAAMIAEAMTNIRVMGSPRITIDKNAPINGASA